MKSIVTILFIALVICSNAQNKLGPIGQWRAHFDNHSIEHVVKGGAFIYAASPYQIIRINNRNQRYWIDKTNGLSDIHIRELAWDDNEAQLIIAYENSNIDILNGDEVYNINAVQLTNLYPDKKINGIRTYKRWALLATNFGIVQIDLITHEIKDSWFPNNNQQAVATYDVLIAHDSVFATTANGLWATGINTNSLVRNNWSRLTQYDQYQVKKLTQLQGNLFMHTDNALFQLPLTNPIIQLNNASIQYIDTLATNLNIAIQYPNKKGAIVQLNKDKSLTTIIDSNLLGIPKQYVSEQNNYWVADSLNGLLLNNNSSSWVNLGGPNAAIQGISAISETELVTPFGASENGFATFNESGWVHYKQIGNVLLPNLNAAAIQNQDHSFWLSSNSSLIHFLNEKQIETIQPNNAVGTFQQIQVDQNNQVWSIQDKQGLVQQ
jgi:hypothetical protein